MKNVMFIIWRCDIYFGFCNQFWEAEAQPGWGREQLWVRAKFFWHFANLYAPFLQHFLLFLSTQIIFWITMICKSRILKVHVLREKIQRGFGPICLHHFDNFFCALLAGKSGSGEKLWLWEPPQEELPPAAEAVDVMEALFRAMGAFLRFCFPPFQFCVQRFAMMNSL